MTIAQRTRARLLHWGARPARALVSELIKDPSMYAWLLHKLGNDAAMTDETIEEACPDDLAELAAFEDCYWMYSSNPLNHGISRLRIDESAYLYRLVRGLAGGRVAEIGRYKGGTTLLMIAAGAHVTSLDNDRLGGQERFTAALESVLRRFRLGDRSLALMDDALSYPVVPGSFDLVLHDTGVDSFDQAATVFEHWWPAVKPGGHFLFRDGKDTVLRDTARFVSSLSANRVSGGIDRELPGALVLCTRSATDRPVVAGRRTAC